jgi:hypothetical protein
MKIVVVLFAVFGLLGVMGLGGCQMALLNATPDGDSKNLRSQLDDASKRFDSLKEQVNSADDVTADEKKDALTAIDDGKAGLQGWMRLPYVYFGAGLLGLVFMVLSVRHAGPRAVHGLGLLAAGIAPPFMTWWTMRVFNKLFDVASKYTVDGSTGIDPAVVSGITTFAALASGGFVIAGLAAFFVKKKVAAAAAAPAVTG